MLTVMLFWFWMVASIYAPTVPACTPEHYGPMVTETGQWGTISEVPCAQTVPPTPIYYPQ
jgi:hypothetical protein